MGHHTSHLPHQEEELTCPSISSEVLCATHGEELRLFCLDDEQLLCVVCCDSEKHARHKFRAVDEALKDCKLELQESLEHLNNRLKFFNKVKANSDQTEIHIKVQAQTTETEIKKLFRKLHHFLQEEEEARIITLKEEIEQKTQMIKERIEGLSREMETLSKAIQATEDQLKADNHVSFLQNYKATVEGVQAVQLTMQKPQLDPGALIDVAKHLGNLTFRVWGKMKEIVSYSPVILDPNTASPELILSDDLSSVRYGERQQLPDNPERCDFVVLGSEGFNSGCHSWDVEVGENRSWFLGAVVESFYRKDRGDRRRQRKIGFSNGECRAVYSSGSITDITDPLPVTQDTRRIRVQLDCNRGKLSFSDPDSNTHLHTFTQTFTEKLFPFICNSDDDNCMSLKVLPDY